MHARHKLCKHKCRSVIYVHALWKLSHFDYIVVIYTLLFLTKKDIIVDNGASQKRVLTC